MPFAIWSLSISPIYSPLLFAPPPKYIHTHNSCSRNTKGIQFLKYVMVYYSSTPLQMLFPLPEITQSLKSNGQIPTYSSECRLNDLPYTALSPSSPSPAQN